MEYIGAGNLNRACVLTDSLESMFPNIRSIHYFELAFLASMKKKCDVAEKYLIKALESGFEYGKGMLPNKTLMNCVEMKKRVLGEYNTEDRFNQEYRKKLAQMIIDDQNFRTGGDTSLNYDVDSVNMIKLLDLINQFGFPDEKKVGYVGYESAFFIILHMDQDLDNKILGSILRTALEHGELTPSWYAWVVDRRRAWGPKKLRPYYYKLPHKSLDSLTRQEVEVVNLRRDSIGLRPI